MANVKISEFDNAGALDGTEVAPIVQSSANYKVSLNTIVTWILNTAWTWIALQTFGRALIKNRYSASNSFTPTGTTESINWDNGELALLSLSSASGNVTLSFSNAQVSGSYSIIVTQGVTARTLTFPSPVKRYDNVTNTTFTMDASSTYGFSVFYDGTNYVINWGKLS
jgi:hypothetical protein